MCQRRIVVVVPAFDEERLIGSVIATMPDVVDRILVVDDGSGDRTSAVAESSGDPRVRVLRHSKRRGVGAAIATGYRAALGETDHPRDVIAVMAGDAQMDPADLERVILPIARGEADYVKGNRFGAPRVGRTMGAPRFVGGRVFSFLTALAIRRRVGDSQCGYTAIARHALASLDLDGLWPSFGYPNDLLGQVAARGMWITEVPVRPVYASERSKLRLRHLPAIFFIVARAAVRCRRARHPNGDTQVSCGSAQPYQIEEDECGRRGSTSTHAAPQR